MEVDGADSAPSWVSEILERPRKPFAEELQAEKARCPAAATALDNIEGLHSRKLYHELTDAFATYLDTDAACDSSASVSTATPIVAPPAEAVTPKGKLEFLWGVVVGLQKHLDAIRLLKMCSGVLADIPPRGSLLFLKKLEEDAKQASSSRSSHGTPGFGLIGAQGGGGIGSDALPPRAFLLSLRAYHSALAGELTEAEEMLEEVQKAMEKLMGVDPVVRGAWHRAAAELARARNKPGEYYKQTLIFLAYTSAASLKAKERIQIAVGISIAALIAPEVYNFGELLQQAVVIAALKDGGETQWLFDLLQAFNKGSLDEFDETMKKYHAKIMQTKLSEHIPELRRKAATAALLRLAFTSSAAGAALQNGENGVMQRKSSSSCLGVRTSSLGIDASRTLSFEAIAKTCRVNEDEVEILLMGAMAQKLLKGKIDQLAKAVHLQWVRPALLIDDHSLSVLQDRLCRWATTADELHKTLQVQTAELLGS